MSAALQSTRLEPAAAAAAAETGFDFSRADFERVRGLIYAKAGINLNAGKQAMVYSRLARRLRETGHSSFRSYLDWLEHGGTAQARSEWQEFVNSLTTNLTSFFREEHHFPLLAQNLAERSQAGARTTRIWCNAASTGEEPYSIAMTVVETLGPRADVKILCSDIDTRVLAHAERGVYAAEARGLSEQRLKQHFLRGTGTNAGQIRARPELRRLVEFHAVNLMHERWSIGEDFDVVFCRNVMIYFDAPTQRKVLERMHQVMAPGALLFAGHSENFNSSRDLFRLRGKTVYQRV